ncbi:hypothetical protein CEXT_564611 [Caerostris extrusa]|uniref:Uncharacterized protein n=1 Tax=Caerostris extrusa TaxID=172846 RepID=A0AAV4XF42_CAEEX|nr:hypothetical protein CEXT_564611 [Caerostris extrusa]
MRLAKSLFYRNPIYFAFQRLQPRHEDAIREENRNSHGGPRRKKEAGRWLDVQTGGWVGRGSKLNSPFRIEVTENVKTDFRASALQPHSSTSR